MPISMSAAFAPTLPLGRTSFRPSIQSSAVVPSCRRSVTPTMVSETNIAKKALKVAAAKECLDGSLLVFCAPLDGLSVTNVRDLKDRMPEGTTLGTVKNTLMRRAMEDTPWACAEEFLKESSVWFFVNEDMKGTVNAYKDFIKEIGREADIRGGVFDGEKYDVKGIEAIAALPNKKELITKVAIAIKAVPTKVAKSIKAVPTKVGRAIKLAVADESADGGSGDPPSESTGGSDGVGDAADGSKGDSGEAAGDSPE